MTDDTLPTLPRPASLSDHSIAPFVGQYSADQMRTYAAEAVRAALAAQVPQPVAWLCEWIDPEDQSITWHQYHDASDPMPDKWDDPPQRVTPLAAAPGASPPAALAVPAGMALVPVEPTPEMLYPDLQTAGPGTQLGDMCAGFGREIWARMLAASQESATTRGGVSRNVEVTGKPRERA